MQYSCSKIFEFLLLVNTVASIHKTVSSTRRHHQKRHLHDIESNSCANKAPANIHESFSRMFNRRESEMYTFLKPTQQLFNIFQPVHGQELTVRPRECVEDSDEVKDFDLLKEHPVSRRAMCIFNYILNYNATRIPASIVEVKCSCRQVAINNETFECEPVYYDMRVMHFDEKCGTYVEAVEKISLGCVTVHPLQTTRGDTIRYHKTQDPGAPT